MLTSLTLHQEYPHRLITTNSLCSCDSLGGIRNFCSANGSGVEYKLLMSDGSAGHQVDKQGGTGLSVSPVLTRCIEVGPIDFTGGK